MNFLTPDWPAPANIRACTTLKTAWGQVNVKSKEERTKLKSLLALPDDPIWLNQTHSNIVLNATLENKDQAADASYTTIPGRVCAILTADCLPILLCNKQGTHIAAIHAGWRGLAGGIVENTLTTLALPPAEILAWMGPAISQSKFEVGEDVYHAFTNDSPEAASAFLPHLPGKWWADLYALARLRLQKQGVQSIYGGNMCTYTQDDLFFSYRREKAAAGRLATVIWML